MAFVFYSKRGSRKKLHSEKKNVLDIEGKIKRNPAKEIKISYINKYANFHMHSFIDISVERTPRHDSTNMMCYVRVTWKLRFAQILIEMRI